MRIRRLPLLACLSISIAFTLSACTGVDPSSNEGATTPASDDGSTVVNGDAGPELAPVGGDGGDASTRITVSGTLVAPAGPLYAPLPPSVRVVIVDALATRQETTSGADGRFSFSNVQPPYDVAVHTLGGNGFGPQVLLGLSTAAPKIVAPTTYSQPPSVKGTVSLNVQVPACPDAQCSVEVSSSSEHGSGATTAFYSPGTTSVPISLEHRWGDRGTQEHLTIQIFEATTSGSAFWHKEISTVLSPGGSASFAPAALISAPVFGTFTATAQDSMFSSEWRRDLSVRVVLPGGNMFYLAQANSSSLVVSVPNIPGATIRAFDTLNVPDSTPQPNRASRYVQSATVGLALSTASTTLTFLPSPENVQPVPNGNLAAKTGVLSWQTATNETAYIEIDSATAIVAIVLTNEKSLALDRLYKLGLPELGAGDHYLTLSTVAPVVLDDVVSADPTKRRDAFAGTSSTSTLHRFVVVP